MTYLPFWAMAICSIAAAFLWGFALGLSSYRKCDAESKTEAIEKLLREEKRK